MRNEIKINLKIYLIVCLSLCLLTGATFGQTSSGGDFTITQSIVTPGNTHTENSNTFLLTGTLGQNLAGKTSSGAPFQLRSGFWFSDLAPTAAGVTVSGRVVGFNDKGIPGVTVVLFGGSDAVERTAKTDVRGNFKFEDVEVGQFYILSVQQDRYVFTMNTYTFNLLEERTDIIFQRARE